MFSRRDKERNPRRRAAMLAAAPGAAQTEIYNLPVDILKADRRTPCERQPIPDDRSNPDGKTLPPATHWAAA
ncbi:MAG: hypothetical protein WA821_08260 [Anaerolineales bacterium]